MISLFSFIRSDQRHVGSVLVVALLAACATDDGHGPQAADTARRTDDVSRSVPEGRYSGPVTPLFPGCGLPATGQLSIGQRAGRLTFALAPFQTTMVIQGEIAADGTLRGPALRGGMIAPGGQPLQIEARARQDGGRDIVAGTLTSGHCRWQMFLRKG